MHEFKGFALFLVGNGLLGVRMGLGLSEGMLLALWQKASLCRSSLLIVPHHN